jgi:hypothetical protein
MITLAFGSVTWVKEPMLTSAATPRAVARDEHVVLAEPAERQAVDRASCGARSAPATSAASNYSPAANWTAGPSSSPPHLDATLRVHDLATGRSRKKWTFSDRSPDDRGAAALAAGRRGDLPVAVVAHAPAGGDIAVRIWNLENGEIIGQLGTDPVARPRWRWPNSPATPSWWARPRTGHSGPGAAADRPGRTSRAGQARGHTCSASTAITCRT